MCSGYVFCDSCVRNVTWEFIHGVNKSRKKKGVCDACYSERTKDNKASVSEMSVYVSKDNKD
jgi:preprotein translocase subunit Sec63